MELSHDLPDSTDWIPTSLPAFEPLEAALRCEVCKEFYNNPVITSCAHTFCSLCIRRCLGADGKCPACKSACQADKLMPNIAVREVATKFQEARQKALELARKDKEDEGEHVSGRKRKVGEADMEEQEPVRHTRARQTRRSTRRDETAGTDDAPFIVPDSEEEKDNDYVPEGMAKCPICQDSMKAHLVFDHVNTCTGESSRGRSTRSRKPATFPTALQNRPKDPTAPSSRLSGLNYAMLTESALKKKLRELGIPSTGSKPLLIRRHQEWLNIFNSNCDASDALRKSKRELLRELDEWERTQGGSATARESHVMRKDFDGQGHATAHRSQFDDLIANARRRVKAVPKTAAEEETNNELNGHAPQPTHEDQSTVTEMSQLPAAQSSDIHVARPYEDNEAALSIIRKKVEEANRTDPASHSSSHEMSNANARAAEEAHADEETPIGFQDPFGSPNRKVPMFALPAEPVCDVDSSNVL